MSRSGIKVLPLSHVTGLAACATTPWLHPIKQLALWIRNKRRIRRAVNELMALDDRMLTDIGLTRGQVEQAARRGRSLAPLDGIARI
jgi:uncharacterized protein YjiS (DUF1127 family)